MNLGEISLITITGALTAYVVAMIAFAIDLSRLRSGATASKPRRAAAVGMAVMVAGALLHIVGVVTRGLAVERVPWANMYEFTISSTVVAAVVFLVAHRRRDLRYLGLFVSGFVAVSLFLALAVLYVAPDGVMPALQSYWLVIHVSVAAGGVGVFSVAAAVSVLQLVKDYTLSRAAAGVVVEPAAVGSGGSSAGLDSAAPEAAAEPGAVRRVLASLPGTDELERFAYRLNAVGFVLWTFTLIAGAIWAEHAWGRYWGWDAKEVWTFVTWVIYAAYLHARATRGWEGRRAAWFSVAGFASILINYYVVNFFFTSLHTYSGV